VAFQTCLTRKKRRFQTSQNLRDFETQFTTMMNALLSPSNDAAFEVRLAETDGTFMRSFFSRFDSLFAFKEALCILVSLTSSTGGI